jgi:hypothetical protein
MPMAFDQESFDLIEACWGRKWDDASYILGGEKRNVLYYNEENYTALHWAANHGELTLTFALLEAGSDPSVKNRFGSTPLTLAACAGHRAVVQMLISYGSPLPLTKLDAGPHPADMQEYSEQVISIIQDAKGRSMEERAKMREGIPNFAMCERAVRIVLSGEFRKQVDADAQRKRDDAKAAQAAKERKRLAEASAHEARMARVRERKAAEDATARAEQKVAERDAMLSLMKQWAIPIFLIGLLSYYLGRVYPAYATLIGVASFGLSGVHTLRLWIDAPLVMAKAIKSAKRG